MLVGLTDGDLEALATAPPGSVRKAARPSLAAALAGGGWAATTVSATMIGGARGGDPGLRDGRDRRRPPRRAVRAGGRPPTLDISSDLEELARTPVAVVCAGPKAILDVPATLEYLETRGVPVVTIGQDELPGFYARSSGLRVAAGGRDGRGGGGDRAPAARIRARRDARVRAGAGSRRHFPTTWRGTQSSGRSAEAGAAGIAGPALTPWLLARIAVLTDGASVRANTALIVNDARVGGRLAAALAG